MKLEEQVTEHDIGIYKAELKSLILKNDAHN